MVNESCGELIFHLCTDAVPVDGEGGAEARRLLVNDGNGVFAI